MHQQPFVADEVVVVFLNGEIVHGGEAVERFDGLYGDPAAVLGFQLLARNQVSGVDPVRLVLRIAPRTEGVNRRGPQGVLFTGNAQLQQFVAMAGSNGCDALQLVLAGGFIVRPDLVANLDALDRHCAVVGLHRRAGCETAGAMGFVDSEIQERDLPASIEHSSWVSSFGGSVRVEYLTDYFLYAHLLDGLCLNAPDPREKLLW